VRKLLAIDYCVLSPGAFARLRLMNLLAQNEKPG